MTFALRRKPARRTVTAAVPAVLLVALTGTACNLEIVRAGGQGSDDAGCGSVGCVGPNALEAGGGAPDGGGCGGGSCGDGGSSVGQSCEPGLDQTCNDDPAVSALWGTCTAAGTCACRSGFVVRPSGRCGPASTSFPEYLPGTWLVGWSGGLDHFSWVRLVGSWPGKAIFRSKVSDRAGVTPYFGCDGEGAYTLTQKPFTVQLEFPPGCAWTGEHVMTMGTVTQGSNFLTGAELSVSAQSLPSGNSLMAFRYPEGFCDATLTTCGDPFSP